MLVCANTKYAFLFVKYDNCLYEKIKGVNRQTVVTEKKIRILMETL